MEKKILLISSISILLIIHLIYPFMNNVNEYEDFESCKNTINPDDFDVYLINLDRNKDRLQRFKNEYNSCDLRFKNVKRIPAIDGKKLNIAEYVSDRAFKEIKSIETSGYRTKHYQLTRGAIGCYLSHLKAYEQIAKSNVEWGLIFEDDVSISKNFYAKLNNILSKIPNNWDMLLLGCHCQKCKKYDLYSHVKKFILLHCYIVKRETAEKLFKKLSEKRIEQQIDSELSDILIKGTDDINVYCVNDALSWQSSQFKTEIQMPIKVNTNVNDSLLL